MKSFGEPVTAGFEHVFHGEPVYSGRSGFQKIDVYDHEHFGRVLTLDDTLQTTERDEFCYHELLIHPALASRDLVEQVLIIGGGDGGALRHALMHDPVRAVICEIDGEVVRVSREYLPAIAGGAFDDPRGEVVIGDGAAYVAEHENTFDAILVDSTDPVGAAEILFSVAFYESCRRALKPDGVIVTQSGTPFYQQKEFQTARANMASVFRTVETYVGFVPVYPGVFWSFTAGTDGAPLSATTPDEVASRLTARSISTKYYTPEVHAAAFALPPFVRDIVEASAPASVPQR